MTVFLFIILALCEIALVVFTLAKQRTKKEWSKNRLIANGGELMLFLIMTLLPGIDLTFRFKGLRLLIIVRIIIAGIRFLIGRKKEEWANINKRTAGIILGAIGVTILTLFSLVPAFVFADYQGRPTSGDYSTAETHAILIDNSRFDKFENDGTHCEVPIYIFYPENTPAGEKYPLVIFSHGAFGYGRSNYSTYCELASNGYVVVSIEHPHHSLFTKNTDGKLVIVDQDFMSTAMSISSNDDFTTEKLAITSEWMKFRTDDMNFALDTIEAACKDKNIPSDVWHLAASDVSKKPTEEEMLSVLSLIDCDKIGLMGHSLGGATSVTVGRMRDDIGAVIDIDGTMLGEETDYKDGKYVFYDGEYPIPLLDMGNDENFDEVKALGDEYVNNFVIHNAKNAQLCCIRNSGHMNFTDLPLASPFLASMLGTGTIDPEHCIDTVNDIILNFMDSNLKEDGSYRVSEIYE